MVGGQRTEDLLGLGEVHAGRLGIGNVQGRSTISTSGMQTSVVIANWPAAATVGAPAIVIRLIVSEPFISKITERVSPSGTNRTSARAFSSCDAGSSSASIR